MICKVISSVEKYGMLHNVKSVAVGISGGADSVCLLHILTKIKERYGIILKAAHINHNLRGDEALRDENFVRELCKEWNVDLEVFSVDIKKEAERLGIGEEECGRLFRYRCFAELGCDAVADAHSMSDSIETMIFNLVRGTAIKGLCGIPAKREPNIIRPLIGCTRKEIEDYCEQNGLQYVTDSTNLTCDYTRNHIRHKLIPDIAYINQSFEKSIGRCMNSLAEDADFLDKAAGRLFDEAFSDNGLSISVLMKSHIALRKRVYRKLLSGYMNKDVDSKHISLFEDVVSGKITSAEVGKNLFVTVKDGTVHIGEPEKKSEQWCSSFENGIAVTPTGVYSLQYIDEICKDAVDVSKIKGELYLSSRKTGDTFNFEKRRVTKSLKKLFNEKKIPLSERNRIAVLHDGESVVWVEGIGVNSPYIPNDSSKEFLIIKKEG